MHLLHESTIKNADGTYEITIYFVKEGTSLGPYTYLIPSQKDVEDFGMWCKKGLKFQGKALKILRKHRTKLIRK